MVMNSQLDSLNDNIKPGQELPVPAVGSDTA